MDETRPPAATYLPEAEERLRRDTDGAMRLYGEFLRRLSHQGVRGIGELGRLFDQLRRSVDAVALPEIDVALAQVGSVVDRLRLLSQRLDRLGEMKRGIGPPHGTGNGRDPGVD